jgi:PKHD-type hydroxylase
MAQQKSTFWGFQTDHGQNWAYQNAFLTKEECEKIIALGESLSPSSSELIHHVSNTSVRNSKNAWIFPTAETEWLFRRLTDSVLGLNNEYFKFDLFGLAEGLQFTKYEAPDGHYNCHIDKATGQLVRKISVTVQLSNPEEYEGGEVHLLFESTPTVAPKEQGTLVVFPSYMLHEVKPVIKGTRYSLVCWVTGAPFK